VVTGFVDPDRKAQDIWRQTLDARDLAEVTSGRGQFVISNLRIREHPRLTGVNQARLRRLPSEEFTCQHANETAAALASATVMHQFHTLQESGVKQQIARICSEGLSIRHNCELFGHVFGPPCLQPSGASQTLRTGSRAFGPNSRFAITRYWCKRLGVASDAPTPKVFNGLGSWRGK
jgi:hypothetical protein